MTRRDLIKRLCGLVAALPVVGKVWAQPKVTVDITTREDGDLIRRYSVKATHAALAMNAPKVPPLNSPLYEHCQDIVCVSHVATPVGNGWWQVVCQYEVRRAE